MRALFAVNRDLSTDSARSRTSHRSPRFNNGRSVFDFTDEVENGVFDELLAENDAAERRLASKMSQKKLNALRGLFNAADDDGGGSIGADELYRVLEDEQLGGDLANAMKTSFATFSERFINNMFTKLDLNGDGHFDFAEFGSCTFPRLAFQVLLSHRCTLWISGPSPRPSPSRARLFCFIAVPLSLWGLKAVCWWLVRWIRDFGLRSVADFVMLSTQPRRLARPSTTKESTSPKCPSQARSSLRCRSSA